MKTRDKIILASLELFNDKGERNVTTNHIAADLSMSPGNLYYHFRNKSDIIYEIFIQYELLVDHYLQIPEDRPLNLNDLVYYLESVFDGLWSYRFFHRDLEFLLDSDERLRKDYRAFTVRCLDSIKKILKGLQKGLDGVLKDLDDEHIESMALNVWLVVTNWMAYLKTAHAGEGTVAINKDMLKQGIYQVLSFTVPYLTLPYVEEIRKLQEKYRPNPAV
ncbi:TetR/AcrR family transcriptional regulator [Alkalimarinus coralli]|uniref:TetR/AcrR family transcriptional regulator n=1 Tax=Alkalimarinus coralli TaxID=2935863 RepID=UPI00202B496E|nr:TetR/AcrR family transcriptional regulator [Alkalimarinus coralli]